MRLRIVFFVLLLFSNIVKAQNDCGKDSIKYETAYKYIVNVFGNKIWVYDSIIDIDGQFFYDDLKDYPELTNKLKQDMLDSDFKMFTPFFSSCIASIHHVKYLYAKYIVCFSTIDDSVLLAELFPLIRYDPYKEKKRKFKREELVFKRLNRFTTLRQYIFIFNKDNTIKIVFSKDVIKD